MSLVLSRRFPSVLALLFCVLSACKVEAPPGQGEERGAASAIVTAAAPTTAATAPILPPSTPVVTATQVAPPASAPPASAPPAVTSPPGGPNPTARPSASAAKKPPVPCPAIACAMPPGCMEMGHDANGCPNCTCARGIPGLSGPPKPGQLPQGVPR